MAHSERTLRAGRLRHRGEIERPDKTTNEYGEPDVSWLHVATVWCSIEPMRGRERMDAMHVQAEVDTRIIMRWGRHVEDVAPSYRFLARGKVYDIKSVINVDERDREIHLMVREHI